VVEVPVDHRPRQGGNSKYGMLNRAWRAFVDLLGVRWLRAAGSAMRCGMILDLVLGIHAQPVGRPRVRRAGDVLLALPGQWIASERAKRSYVPTAFWWLSLAGGSLSLIYAVGIHNLVFTLARQPG